MSENCRVLTKEQYDELFRKINELEKNLAGAEQSVQEGLEINEELKAENRKLKYKLYVAVKALEDYADEDEWMFSHERTGCVSERCNEYNEDYGYEIAQEALKQIMEVK